MSKLSEMLDDLDGGCAFSDDSLDEGRRGGTIFAALNFMETDVGILKREAMSLEKSPHGKNPKAKALLVRLRNATKEVRKLASEIGAANEGVFMGR